MNKTLFISVALLAVFALVLTGWQCKQSSPGPSDDGGNVSKFESDNDLVAAFEAHKAEQRAKYDEAMELSESAPTSADAGVSAERGGGGIEYSETNIQVAGVDEADIVKSDGEYIYALAQGNLNIMKAYPAGGAEILSTIEYEDFSPQEMFVDGDRLLVFGAENYDFESQQGEPVEDIMPYPRYVSVMAARLYDIADRSNPEFLRRVEFEGSYLTSRKIGTDVYFVITTYPYYDTVPTCEELIPLYRESKEDVAAKPADMQPSVTCSEVGYIEPLQAENFTTVAGMSMEDENASVEREVIVGSGQNVYASPENLYIAQTSWPEYDFLGEVVNQEEQATVISKFILDDRKVDFAASGEVPGYILNQFSMDEYDNHFRIATTTGSLWGDDENKSQNNIYVLGEDMARVGTLENLAPGESIYSVRFMQDRGYLVTFKKVDPLFVLDLSEHSNPNVLGRLKIPGYSDYLHPYDDNHIIGIGKDTEEAGESEKEQRDLDFAWYQGVKMAIFDVTDVANPIEMHKVVIGDRGTDSDALYDHKAFLFDKNKDLLVLPITLAEIQGEKSADNQYGDYTFQGAYVYNITLENGFDLRGRITHYDDPEIFDKSGFYFYGDANITRSLYIDNVLYTLSKEMLKLNNLTTLEELKALTFPEGNESNDYPVVY